MIVVDSSVWIANFRNANSDVVRKLEAIRNRNEILVGDLVLLEILQGARDDRQAALIERELRTFEVAAMLTAQLASSAASNYRKLRSLGITMRSTPDLIIGTFCIEHDHVLLHDDRDFGAMQRHLGLLTL